MLRPNEERSNRLIIVLWIYTGFQVLTSISDIMQYFLLRDIQKGTFNMQEINANDFRQSIVGIIMLLFYIGVAIVFIQWFRRAYYNLHQLSNKCSFAEGWAAGAWFVPFMNLGRPFTIMREMVDIAEGMLIKQGHVEEDTSRRRSVGIWWTLWIIISIVSSSNSRIQTKSDSIDVITTTTLIDIAIAWSFIPLTFVTVRMIKKYAELEKYLPYLSEKSQEIKIDDSDILDAL
ncbi:MAG: DUF4328 domain-containing protein [Fluviicola sp.]|nr:DUF4328 domain-containing protein [Fluviicola sp.]